MNGTFFEPAFRYVYVEDRAAGLPQTRRILAKLPQAHVIPIRHYKDIFNRSRQDITAQSRSLALILADEPTGALDSKTGRKIMDIFHKLHKEQGKTIVLITHSQELAEETERILTLKDGEIVAERGGSRVC